MLQPTLTSSARTLARCTAITLASTTVVTTTSLVVYTNTEQGLGLKRELDFWKNVVPIVWDYWWNASFRSPKVKLQQYVGDALSNDAERDEHNDSSSSRRKELLKTLHQRNAPIIFQTMLNLGGLYIKLGQVLSVTALPIPEEYRTHFRTLQSNVPGHEDFESVVKPTIEQELNVTSLHEIFDSIEKVPCGAASIGQAHRATLKSTKENVIIKVQYPNAKWQVPADIECVGDLLKLCVWFGLVDESSANMSFDEFARQFMQELDYEQETRNLKEVYQSSLDVNAPYIKRGVVIPRVFENLCTKQVITMTYLPGPKFEEEARQQLELLGIDTKGGMKDIVKRQARENGSMQQQHSSHGDSMTGEELAMSPNTTITSWKMKLSSYVGNLIGVDSVFSLVRFARRIMLWSTVAAVQAIHAASSLAIIPTDVVTWAYERQHAIAQAKRMNWTKEAVYTLIDVHGYQILREGLFNADCHPGNILVVLDENNPKQNPKLGLIDYGQCKRLTKEERVKIAKLIVSIADKESDEVIANCFRDMGIATKNDSTRFLADFGRLMFDSFDSKHLDHSWHKELHKEDRVLYFPKELSMVYRTSLLLRGLAVSLQFNPSIGKEWRRYAQATIDESC
jgi:aarF domain-containing kinase